MTYFKYSSLLASLAFLGLAAVAFLQPQLKPQILIGLTAATLVLAAFSDLAGLMLKDRQDRKPLEFLAPLVSLAAVAGLLTLPLKNQTALLLTVLALWFLTTAGLNLLLARNLPRHQAESPLWRRLRALVTGLLGFLLLLYPIFPKNWTAILLLLAFTGEGLLSAWRFYKLNQLF